ncbi:MAG: GtrA family protein [Bacteroidetes bacterium]|nr:GtrA family protein [Bacteroidota bacterium]
MFRYFVAAGVATVVDIGVYYIMLHYVFQNRLFTIAPYLTVSSPSLSLFISYTCGLFTNFFISKYFVFTESEVRSRHQFFRFAGVALFRFVSQLLLDEFTHSPLRVVSNHCTNCFGIITGNCKLQLS